MAKFVVTPQEIETIVKKHLEECGLNIVSSSIKMEEYKTYEYYGDPQNENRREVTKERLKGVEVEVTIFE